MTGLFEPIPRAAGPTRDSPLTQVVRAAATVRPGFITSVVDGGAGTGGTTEPIRLIGSDVVVTAFEPLPENVSVLHERFASLPNVVVRGAAITDTAGRARLLVPSRINRASGAWKVGTSFGGFVMPPRTLKPWKSLLAYALRGRLRRNGRSDGKLLVSVPAVRLDEEFRTAPDVVKMDLQGGEMAALRGAGALLSDVKLLQLELQFLSGSDRQEIVQLLQAHNFALYLGDLQFSLPSMSDGLRAALAEAGVKIDQELADSAFAADLLVMGRWAGERGLPFDGCHLAPDFARLLEAARLSYFQSDVIALNRAHATEWQQILASVRSAGSVTAGPSR